MDIVNKAYMFALSYRFTVALNMEVHHHQPVAWMTAWHAALSACTQDWREYLGSMNGDHGDRDLHLSVIQIVGMISGGLSTEYANFTGNIHTPEQAGIGYSFLKAELHKLAFAPFFSDWELAEFYTFGQQLAHYDLRSHFVAAHQPDLSVLVDRAPRFTSLSDTSLPGAWSEWPDDRAFNELLNQYINNRHRFAASDSFSMGPLACLTLSILCPTRFPSTVWCWEDWNKRKRRKSMHQPWHLFFAGKIFEKSPMLISVDDENDLVFVQLLKKMSEDKQKELDIEHCGWVIRKVLWPKKSDNTRTKAWRKLTTKTLELLGEFEPCGRHGQSKNTTGLCRAPVKLASKDCLIFIDELSTSEISSSSAPVTQLGGAKLRVTK